MLDDTTVRLILAQKPPPHPPMGQGLFIHEVSRSQTTTHQRRQNSSGRVISSSQRHLPDNTQHSQQISMRPPVGIETTILADERKRTYALDRAATVTGKMLLLVTLKQNCLVVSGLQALLCLNNYNNQQMIIKLLNMSLFWASPIQSIYPHRTSWRSILILSTHLGLGLPSGLLPSGSPTKMLYTPSPHPYLLTYLLIYLLTYLLHGAESFLRS